MLLDYDKPSCFTVYFNLSYVSAWGESICIFKNEFKYICINSKWQSAKANKYKSFLLESVLLSWR